MKYQGITLTDAFRIENLYSLHYFEYMNSFFFPGESHNFWEFVCVDKGEVTIGAGSHTHTLKRGQIIFHKPNEFHWVKAGTGAAPNLVVISFSCSGQLMDFFEGKILQVTSDERKLLAKAVMEAKEYLSDPLGDPYQTVLRAIPGASPVSGQLIRQYIEQFLISLYRRCIAQHPAVACPAPVCPPAKMTRENTNEEIFSDIIRYLERHVPSHVTIEKICRDNLIGRSRLQKLFQQKCGQGIIEYYTGMKIEAAKQMIRTEKMNFSQISENLGYSSIHYFSRQFKKKTGMTPSEYAASIKAISERPFDSP